MIPIQNSNRNAGFWWAAIISLAAGIAVYVVLKPVSQDPEIQRYRALALVASLTISGLCVIIGTRGRWFGKGL